MKIQIEFFKDKLVESIGAGIYEIDVCKDKKTEVLYIGESVFVLVRCASHLYELKKNPNYFGFTEKTVENPEIKLIFHLLEQVDDTQKRKNAKRKL